VQERPVYVQKRHVYRYIYIYIYVYKGYSSIHMYIRVTRAEEGEEEDIPTNSPSYIFMQRRSGYIYGVVTISRLLKIIGLFWSF